MPLHSGDRKKYKIRWIVVHYPAAPGKPASWLRDYYSSTGRSVSAHYIVDSKETLQIIPLKKAAFHCATSGIQTYCTATNCNSIGIDLMDDKINKSTLSVSDEDWFIPELTLYRASYLIAYLMRQFDIPIERVIRHYDVTHKLCPRPLVGDDINKFYTMSGNDRWAQFKEQIKTAADTLERQIQIENDLTDFSTD